MKNDFKIYEGVTFGELQNLSIQISGSSDLAVAFIEAPVKMNFGEEQYDLWYRSARTFRKENGTWLIVQSLSSTASLGQSSSELVEQSEPKETD